MKGKLHKMVSGYILSLNGDIDDPYAIVNEELAKDHEWHRLSLKNCQAVERGYDLDEIAEQEFPYDFDCPLFETLGITEKSHKSILIGMLQGTLQKGFQKALELMGDKKFSEEDIRKAMETMANLLPLSMIDNYIQSLQQTEWDVEVETVPALSNNGNVYYGDIPKLDENNCLILKRIWKEN